MVCAKFKIREEFNKITFGAANMRTKTEPQITVTNGKITKIANDKFEAEKMVKQLSIVFDEEFEIVLVGDIWSRNFSR